MSHLIRLGLTAALLFGVALGSRVALVITLILIVAAIEVIAHILIKEII